MSQLKIEPRICIEGTTVDPASEDFTESCWSPYRDFHIAAHDEESNNSYIGQQIGSLYDYVRGNPEMWFRITYREVRTLRTTAGDLSMGDGSKRAITDVCHQGTHMEEFRDRNGDGYMEFNQALPVYDEFPRFLTEHDTGAVQGEGKKTKAELQVGDYVRISDPAYCREAGSEQIKGYVEESFYGQIGQVTMINSVLDNHMVKVDDVANHIHPSYLTKVNADGSPIEEDDELQKKDGAAPGEEVEGEDEPDDTIHVSDGDVITVYDELGHEKQMRISVI